VNIEIISVNIKIHVKVNIKIHANVNIEIQDKVIKITLKLCQGQH